MQAGKQLRFFMSAGVKGRRVLRVGLRQVPHREMDGDGCSVSGTPSGLRCFESHRYVATLETERGCRTVS